MDLQLSVPNIVTLLSNNDEEAAAAAVTGSETGNFTLVYNQGVELWLGSEVWFAFSSGNYTHTQDECATTRPGWVHQIGAGPDSEQDWACFIAIKQQEDCGSPRAEQQHKKTKIILEEENAAVTDGSIDSTEDDADSLFRTDHDLIARINAAQSSWVAAAYPEHERRTIREMQRRRGTPLNSGGGGGGWESFMPPRSSALQSSQPAYPSSAASIPDSFDWRNVSGVNFVSPVRDQSGCGRSVKRATEGRSTLRFTDQPLLTCSLSLCAVIVAATSSPPSQCSNLVFASPRSMRSNQCSARKT